MVIAIHGYHDASVSIKDGGKYYVYEFERFTNRRYAILTQEYPQVAPTDEEFIEFFKYIKNVHKIESVKFCYYSELFENDLNKIRTIFPVQRFKWFDHHRAHATCAYFQSGFKDAYIISYDGDGTNADGSLSSFTAWHGSNRNVTRVKDFQPTCAHTLGGVYMTMTWPLSSIKKRHGIASGLPNAGKLMGLCAYGTPVEEWKNAVEEMYDKAVHGSHITLREKIGIDIEEENSLSGQDELNFAATAQWGFENKFFKNFNSLNIPPGSNICISGGCAMNIKVNQMLYEKGYNVYVPPNPGDCGLTTGMLFDCYKDLKVNITYAGFPILDPEYTSLDIHNESIDNKRIAELLYNDKRILGYIKGNSECGPRALGHRSILCYPDVPDLKNKLNAEIKFREWFRPFGAICKLENLHKYFENACETPYMSFCPTLRPEYRLPAITHIDNTCRIQTITKEQHPELYEILTHIEDMGGVGMLLNTSFNIKGKPILTRLKDACDTLRDTKLYGFVYNDQLHTLRNRESWDV